MYMKTTPAQAIKKELKAIFKGVKFSVRYESFAGGDSVRIEYINGPALKLVKEIADKYQYGHFNAMSDIYEISNSNDQLLQAKYVFVVRELTEEAKKAAIDSARAKVEELLKNSKDNCIAVPACLRTDTPRFISEVFDNYSVAPSV